MPQFYRVTSPHAAGPSTLPSSSPAAHLCIERAPQHGPAQAAPECLSAQRQTLTDMRCNLVVFGFVHESVGRSKSTQGRSAQGLLSPTATFHLGAGPGQGVCGAPAGWGSIPHKNVPIANDQQVFTACSAVGVVQNACCKEPTSDWHTCLTAANGPQVSGEVHSADPLCLCLRFCHSAAVPAPQFMIKVRSLWHARDIHHSDMCTEAFANLAHTVHTATIIILTQRSMLSRL